MLLILLALDHDTIWVVPGSEVSQQNLWITLGSQRDEAWGVSQVGLVLMEHFRNSSFPSISMQDAILQYGGNYIVEELSHAQLDSEFAAIGLQLDRPISVPDAVDSVLRWRDHQWRVQEKATHRQNGDDERLVGIYIVPNSVLAKRKLIGHEAVNLGLYPPWAQPRRPAVARKHGWQLDHFVDLRRWKGKGACLDSSSHASLMELIQKLEEPAQTR